MSVWSVHREVSVMEVLNLNSVINNYIRKNKKEQKEQKWSASFG
jgi:Tfp pilus assembly pilus retraction ATPase PilT